MRILEVIKQMFQGCPHRFRIVKESKSRCKQGSKKSIYILECELCKKREGRKSFD
jgi:hypothetical protein